MVMFVYEQANIRKQKLAKRQTKSKAGSALKECEQVCLK